MASNAARSEMGSELDVKGEDNEGSYYPPPFYDIPNKSKPLEVKLEAMSS
jgi:hypothetical protein